VWGDDLTLHWPYVPSSRRVLLAELDRRAGRLLPRPAGTRARTREPDCRARRGSDPEFVWEHCRSWRTGRRCWPGRAPRTRPVARSACSPSLSRLGELAADVLVDCGRLAGASPNPCSRAPIECVGGATRLATCTRSRAISRPTNPRQDPHLVLVATALPRPRVARRSGRGGARLPWDPDRRLRWYQSGPRLGSFESRRSYEREDLPTS